MFHNRDGLVSVVTTSLKCGQSFIRIITPQLGRGCQARKTFRGPSLQHGSTAGCRTLFARAEHAMAPSPRSAARSTNLPHIPNSAAEPHIGS